MSSILTQSFWLALTKCLRYNSTKALTLSVWPSVWGCILVEKFKLDPSILNNSFQNFPMKRPSRSLTMAFGRPQYLTMWRMKSRATFSAGHSLVAGMNVAYLEKRSTMTRMVPKPSVFGIPVMKSIERFSHGPSETGRGSRSPTDDLFSVLSCWHTRHVFTYASASSRRYNQ